MRKLWIGGLAAALVLLGGCGRSSTPAGGSSSGPYSADITRTSLGIPHIKANDFGGLGYGYGYAFAEDNLCVMQQDFVTVRGERARYFGRDGSYTIVPNGVTADNVTSDFYWKSTATDAAIAPARDKTLADYRNVTRGFVAGYNRYVRELRRGGHAGRHAACRSADWLFEIEENDMYRRFYRLALIASGSVWIKEVAGAQPPPLALPAAAPTPEAQAAALRADPGPFRFFDVDSPFGSNMYALGKDATTDGSSMVFGNPHFPWTGTERLYLAHATIPGKLDIMGASLYGVPAILIGFNDKLAWSHTVSTAYRFTFYELTLNPANPTQYLYDGAFRDMSSQTVTVRIKESDGSTSEESRRLYRSHYGPILVLQASGVPILGWTNLKAYAFRDANAENDALINQFARWNQAGSLDEFIRLHGEVLGIPWINTVASGPGGKAYYGDLSVVPHVTDEQITTCQALPLHQVIQQLAPGLPLLDGSRSACEWGSDADAPRPGIFGPGNLPSMQRDDWVHNCNDSYWLTHPEQPIEGYNSIIGAEGSARTLRTRLCIQQIQKRLDGSDGRPGNRFDIPTLQEVTLSSQILSAQMERDTVVDTLCPFGTLAGSAGPVNVSAACAALADWDLKANLDSRGAHVWREFWRRIGGRLLPLPVGPSNPLIWTTPFSADDPVNTPRGLNIALPTVQQGLADAVQAVADAGFAPDAALGEIQHPRFIDAGIPVFGGEGHEGAFTIVRTGAITPEGYGIDYGNSYIQTVTWGTQGVKAHGFVTYSQSTDPASPHFSDYTREYSAKRWHPLPFKPAEIEADAIRKYRLSQ
ncbi:MAG TPA: penicillin acylase family protein [Solimonas sp.]|nr:penicillin acylase family protein [Solimonas sp.]